jgi:hypothetical protein
VSPGLRNERLPFDFFLRCAEGLCSRSVRSNLAGDRAGAGGVGGDEGELPKHIINSVPRYVHPSLTRLAYQ